MGCGEVEFDGILGNPEGSSGPGIWYSRIGGSTAPYTAIELVKTKLSTS